MRYDIIFSIFMLFIVIKAISLAQKSTATRVPSHRRITTARYHFTLNSSRNNHNRLVMAFFVGLVKPWLRMCVHIKVMYPPDFSFLLLHYLSFYVFFSFWEKYQKSKIIKLRMDGMQLALSCCERKRADIVQLHSST